MYFDHCMRCEFVFDIIQNLNYNTVRVYTCALYDVPYNTNRMCTCTVFGNKDFNVSDIKRLLTKNTRQCFVGTLCSAHF
jgi:hypothetical protein